ncbi:AMP-binding protein [Polynucleobacter sp. 30F-ANTBAC]|uniref:class I adenylate-forming enzyme family protein n=1 Tax=Polynucleobacter sp. 30F-ANTBAC TaxID=2689095 RepID=UPI001C0BB09B|nr:AMP-binding protein [Polynucleobacter sp. 30F-ANTBAC]MBU3600444.1 AMP-binding protein [Polynucleobacter sp. 30F-ANTBAC]
MMQNLLDQLTQTKKQLLGAGSPFELGEIEVDSQTYPYFPKAPHNLIELLSSARQQFGPKEFLAWESQRYTFEEFFEEADRLAAGMQQLGIQKGDRVAIAMRNRPEWLVAAWATIKLGAILVPINSWGKRDEIIFGLKDAQPKIVFLDKARHDLVCKDLEGLHVNSILVEGSSEDQSSTHNYLYSELLASAESLNPVEIAPGDFALLMYTSGTTSHPKGALSTHRSIVQSLWNIQFNSALAAMLSPEKIKSFMTSGINPTALVTVPFFHVSGLHAQFFFALLTGRKLLIAWKWDVENIIDLIESEKVTQLNGSPAMIQELLGHPKFSKIDRSSLFALGLGGGAASSKLLDDMQEVQKMGMLGIGYGATETNGIGAQASGDLYLVKPKSAGIISPIVEVKCLSAANEILDDGQPGEICIRSLANMTSYWGNEKATADAIVDSWYHSGDVGYVDADGFLFIVDRIKEIINKGGEKVSALEVEDCLYSNEDVVEAVVFSIPDEKYGEAVMACVAIKPTSTIDEPSLKLFLEAKLANYKIPKHIEIRTNALPRSAAGKLLKREIREEYLSGKVQ